MPTLQELLDMARTNPTVLSDETFKSSLVSALGAGGATSSAQPAPSQAQASTIPSTNPLKPLLDDPTFQQWFKESFPDKPYPPTNREMGTYYKDYVKAGGQIPPMYFAGYDFQPGRRYNKTQAREFNSAFSSAFEGNAPFKAGEHKSTADPTAWVSKHVLKPGIKLVKDLAPLAGAALGGAVGGIPGALAGGLGGALLGGGTSGGSGGTKEAVERFPLLTPMQEKATNQLLQQGMANTDWGPIEQKARQDFYTKTVPGIAARFESMGGGGTRFGALAPTMKQAGADLENQLAQARSGFGMQQLGLGLQPRSFENIFRPGQPSFAQTLTTELAKGAGSALPFFLKGV